MAFIFLLGKIWTGDALCQTKLRRDLAPPKQHARNLDSFSNGKTG